MLRWGRRLLLAATMGAVVILGFGASAQASTTVVDGGGTVTNDFGDHYGELGNSLCNGCGDSWGTDLVLMWQTILYSEGMLTASGIDGYFGSDTASATKKFQLRAGLTVDGKVGPATWDVADGRLRWARSADRGWVVIYHAERTSGWVWFHRGNSCCEGADGDYHLIGAHNATGDSWIDFDPGAIRLFSLTIGRA